MDAARRRSQLLGTVLRYAVLVLVSLIILFPLVVIVSSAFKNEQAIFTYPIRFIPEEPTFENFRDLAENFPRYILNSFKVTLIIVVVQVATATTGAYAFSKLDWRGRDLLFLTYIASIMIPIHAVIVPQFILVRNLGLYDSHAALVLVSAFTAFGTFLAKQFFMTIPDSLLEAARIDGASEFSIFGRIMLPLARPVLAALVIFSFRYFWNDFFAPLIYITSAQLKTLPLGLADFVSEYTVQYGPQMAASLISIIPVMIVFLIAQRQFVEGVVMTGMKG
jgi:multiple sugar transport system permease protein